VSWAAHELESYFLQDHAPKWLKGTKASYLAILLGCLLPDLFTKLPVYGLKFGDVTFIKASQPWKYHRGWPGVGFTHSILFVALFSVVILAWKKNRAWFVGILIGGVAHVLTDTFDSVGTMLFFPFTTQHYSTGMWRYASQAGRYGDAAAYYSSFGGVWDFGWLLLALTGWRILKRDYFIANVIDADPAWGTIKRTFRLSNDALLGAYRAWFVYGASRIFAWFIWARLLNPKRGTQKMDLSWGGPAWVEKAPRFQVADTWLGAIGQTAIGITGTTITVLVLWRLFVRRLWNRAH
jgi:membrane-bound metal-dependent hydrolase YbcI (DUF457 family)